MRHLDEELLGLTVDSETVVKANQVVLSEENLDKIPKDPADLIIGTSEFLRET